MFVSRSEMLISMDTEVKAVSLVKQALRRFLQQFTEKRGKYLPNCYSQTEHAGIKYPPSQVLK
jgi:hypothetical protein